MTSCSHPCPQHRDPCTITSKCCTPTVMACTVVLRQVRLPGSSDDSCGPDWRDSEPGPGPDLSPGPASRTLPAGQAGGPALPQHHKPGPEPGPGDCSGRPGTADWWAGAGGRAGGRPSLAAVQAGWRGDLSQSYLRLDGSTDHARSPGKSYQTCLLTSVFHNVACPEESEPYNLSPCNP